MRCHVKPVLLQEIGSNELSGGVRMKSAAIDPNFTFLYLAGMQDN